MKDGICQSGELWGSQQRVVLPEIKWKDLCPGQVSRVGLLLSASAALGLNKDLEAVFSDLIFPQENPKFSVKLPQT